jgi:biotin operon repressor
VSNVLKRNFFSLPQALLQRLKEMTQAELCLYVLLYGFAQKHSAVTIGIPAYKVRDWTGLSPTSVTMAAQKLKNAGMVILRSGAHGVTMYTLTDLETIREGEKTPDGTNTSVAEPLLAPKGFRGTYVCPLEPGRSARSKKPAPKPEPSAPSNPITWSEVGAGSQNLVCERPHQNL